MINSKSTAKTLMLTGGFSDTSNSSLQKARRRSKRRSIHVWTNLSALSKNNIDHVTGMPNTSYFHFNKEDHTLGNLLRSKLLSSAHVLFAAYRVSLENHFYCFYSQCQVPHPLFPTIELRVQTDGEITPKEAVVACSRELITELETFWRNFKREYDLRKMVQQDQSGA